jgi:hypothetical protein
MLRKLDQEYLESFEMWCWRRMEISWTERVKNEVLRKVKEERKLLHTIKRRKSITGLATSCIAFRKRLWKEREKGREDEEEDVSRYWMTLRKRQATGN